MQAFKFSFLFPVGLVTYYLGPTSFDCNILLWQTSMQIYVAFAEVRAKRGTYSI